MATQVAEIITLEQAREGAIDSIVSIFADDCPANVLRGVARAAFMQGAFAGRAVGSVRDILDLQDRDVEEMLERVRTGRRARELGRAS